MAKVYPVSSQLAQSISAVTINNDGSAVVSINLGYLDHPEGDSAPVFRSISATSHVVSTEDADAVIAVTPRESDESYSEYVARCLLIQLQNSGRAVR